MIKVAGAQMDVALGETDRNLQAMLDRLRETAADGALLTVFPECALTGYCFESLDEALPHGQPVPGPATDAFRDACMELGAFAVFGMLERDGDRLFNSSVLVGPEGLIGTYRKIHLPYLGIDRFTTPGDQPPRVWDCGPLRLGMNICYDGSFPETARCMALDGADLIVLPTNWPPGAEYMADYLINARASENHVYFLAVNRVGEERGFRFIGRSRLAHPRGETLADFPHDEPGVLWGEIDVDAARAKHIVRVPGKHEIDRLADRRPQMYGRLTSPTGDVPLTTRRKNLAAGESVSPEARDHARQEELYRRIWAPWRLEYVSKGAPPPPDDDRDFISRAADSDDNRENLVVDQDEHVITLLNRFPYNNGHLLVCPVAVRARLDELTAEEQLGCSRQITKMVAALEQLFHPDGFNIGLNLGKAAGAGVPGHLHWHIVPRWNGDTNFMPVLSGVSVIPQSLDALWELLTGVLRNGD
ncbi:MAG: HIT domain-containing protein [Planctomycetales bacterium]